jgi:hypothetical protein
MEKLEGKKGVAEAIIQQQLKESQEVAQVLKKKDELEKRQAEMESKYSSLSKSSTFPLVAL